MLKCFLPNLDNRGTVIHELHMAIDREFRKAGIEIAFPQQDVHVRSIDVPLPIPQIGPARGNLPWPQPSTRPPWKKWRSSGIIVESGEWRVESGE